MTDSFRILWDRLLAAGSGEIRLPTAILARLLDESAVLQGERDAAWRRLEHVEKQRQGWEAHLRRVLGGNLPADLDHDQRQAQAPPDP